MVTAESPHIVGRLWQVWGPVAAKIQPMLCSASHVPRCGLHSSGGSAAFPTAPEATKRASREGFPVGVTSNQRPARHVPCSV